jgi:hypothetical protein
MNQSELLQTVRAKLPTREAITATFIQMRYRVLQSQARQCIADLQRAGLIGQEWDPQMGGYPVIKESENVHGSNR